MVDHVVYRARRALDQRRPLHQRRRRPVWQRLREVTGELSLTLLEGHACAALDEVGGQALVSTQPVESGIAGVGQTGR
jgi:hypothetical protein